MQRITTQYTTNANGAGKIVAKGGGKQKTVSYDHALTPSQNHVEAAKVVAKALGWNADDDMMVDYKGNGKGVFTNFFH